MIAVALKGLAGRKVRALLTAFAVVIGVSMVSGTFILTDTMQRTFDGLFAASYEETDAVIAGKEIVKSSTSGSATMPESLLAEVRKLPEVGSAGGTVSPAEVNGADIIGRDGKAVAKESLGTSIDAANVRFSPLKLKTGEWPEGPKQVAIDAGTAAKEPYAVGDPVRRSPGRHRVLPGRGHGVVRRRRLARFRQHRRVGHEDGPVAAASRGPLRLDLDRRRGRHARRPSSSAPFVRSCRPPSR